MSSPREGSRASSTSATFNNVPQRVLHNTHEEGRPHDGDDDDGDLDIDEAGMPLKLPSYKTLFLCMLCLFTLQSALSVFFKYAQSTPHLFTVLARPSIGKGALASGISCNGSTEDIDLNWHAPTHSDINNLNNVINGHGVYGFIFNSSQGPSNTYNWCNMPHVNPATYPKVHDSTYKLAYVEVIHRHHKRTPYAANTFPVEGYAWECSDEGLFYRAKPISPGGNNSVNTYWSTYISTSNPFAPSGFNGSCQFPQITRQGLDDSHQHGVDLKAVYGDMLDFLPAEYNANLVSFRVTNNVITSQVASMLIAGMYPSSADRDIPLLIQASSIDSLEPAYSCPSSSRLFGSYGPGSSSPAWQEHLIASESLFARLDSLSGVIPQDEAWHRSWDHYFDNLSARLCHAKPLPCNVTNPSDCVEMKEAEQVFRLGEYEYAFLYREAAQSLPVSVGSFGVWIAELARNIRHAVGEDDLPSTGIGTGDKVKYRHNIAHDGSMARLLAVLQIDEMVWPGMGAEVVFEVYRREDCWFLRVLWGGQVLLSSHPGLGRMDMVPVERVLAYFDGLVGVDASKIPGICQQEP